MKRIQHHSSFTGKETAITGPSIRRVTKWLLSGILPGRFFALLFILLMGSRAFAQEDTSMARSLEVYGFIMMDMGYDAKQINPNWYDALRITKLPSYKDQYAP